MANITLRQLRYFKAVAQHGHFGQAAEASAVSQPALSVQIKELEERLGCTLFEREPRAVRLTGLGAELLERAEDILQSVAELENLARAAQGHLSGALRIGVIPTIAPYLLPGLLGDLARSHPELDIRMRETMTSTLLGELGQGRLDLAILALPVSEPNLEEADLFDERFVLIRPEAEDGLPVPDPASLSERRLLLLEEGHCFRDQALSFCGLSPATGKRQKTLDGSSLTTLVRMVEAGFGVTLIPEMAVEAETRAARVSVARFQGPAPARRVGMVWRKTDPMRGHYRELADQIRGKRLGVMNEAEMSEVEMIAKLKAVLKACEETHRFSKHSRHFFKVGEWLLAFEHIYSFVEGNEEFRRSVEQNYEPLLRLFHRFRNFDTLPISKW